MNPLHVVAFQMGVDDHDVAANVTKISALAGTIRTNVDLLVLPELCDVGYDLSFIRARTTTGESPVLEPMRTIAARLDCFVAAGIVETEGERLFDSLAVVDPRGGLVSCYRKIELYEPAGEADVFEAGHSLETVEVRGWTIGLAICNDLRYPEIARGLATRGIDALLLSAAWPFPRVRHFTTLLEARAIENQIYVVAANRVGRLGDALFCGHSRVIDPHGVVVASAGDDGEAFIRSTLEPDTLERVRTRPGPRERRVDFE